MSFLKKLFGKKKEKATPIENNPKNPVTPTTNDFEDFPAIGGIMVDKTIFNNNQPIQFLFRYKPMTDKPDSGFMVFPNRKAANLFEAEDLMIVSAQTILGKDALLADILLKAPYGSVWEKQHGNWQQVHDYLLDEDFLTTEPLTDKFYFVINQLFLRSTTQDDTMKFTTGDKTLFIDAFELKNATQEELLADFKIDFGKDHASKILDEQDLSDERILRYFFEVKESDAKREYHSIYAMVATQDSAMQISLHFDNPQDKQWAIATLKSMNTYHHTFAIRKINHVEYKASDAEEELSLVQALSVLGKMIWDENTFWVQGLPVQTIQFHGTEQPNQFDCELITDNRNEIIGYTQRINYYEMIQLIQYYYENDSIGEHPTFTYGQIV